MNNIENKVIVITGASSGIGEISARYLAERGAKLVLAARRVERLERLVSDIQAKGGEAIAVATDVSKQSDVEQLMQKAVATFGRVDVLVNNAGVMLMAPMAQTKVAEWDKMIDVNIKGVLYGIAAALPIMQTQKSGHFINISSVAGLKVSGGIGTVYSATKFAVRAISEGLRMEVGGDIRTTTIYPGAIATELADHSSDQTSSDAIKGFYAANEISADAIAKAIVFAIEQPADVDINEITVRPTRQEF
ncbi:SDR family oxidoreductase [Glaesserella sp.]|uniref:SDR family oxidoreductase n=1 Tax=Glaesserella sp. TaxID=2094731 RepID=UPI00359FECDF